MLIEEVEAMERHHQDDDWWPLHAKVEDIRRMGEAMGSDGVKSGCER